MIYENIIKEIVNKIRTEKPQPTTTQQKVYISYLEYLKKEKRYKI